MKAIELIKNGKADSAFQMSDIPKPECGEGQVLIKVEAFGLNYADVLARKGLYPDCPPLPAVIGYEVVGTIEELAEDIEGIEVGDRVVAFTRFGGYAEFAVTDARAVVKVNKEIDAGIAAALAIQYSTALYNAKSARLTQADKVLIHAAAGGVGTALCQYALSLGCEVFATAGSQEKLNYLKELGVDHPINYRENDFELEVRNQKQNNRVDVIFDPIGGKTFKKGMKLLNYGGRVVLFGVSSRSKGGFLSVLKLLFGFGFYTPIKWLMKSQSVIGVNMLRIADHRPDLLLSTMNEVFSLYEKGVFKPLVGGDFKVENIASAHSLLESRKSKGKIIIRW